MGTPKQRTCRRLSPPAPPAPSAPPTRPHAPHFSLVPFANFYAATQGLLAIRSGEMAAANVSSSNGQRLEELEDQLSGLRKEREQLYAQIQADSAIKKFQEQKIRDLETSSGGTPGGPQADSTGGGAGGSGGSEQRVRELEKECNGLRDQVEATEIKLAEERSRHQQEVLWRNA